MNKKITNVDTMSALIDRMICERIKLYFFEKDNRISDIAHQRDVLIQLKIRLSDVFAECLYENDYDYLEEKRTFSVNDVIQELGNLTLYNIEIGENDRLALGAAKEENLNDMKKGILSFRYFNECRSKAKIKLDKLFKDIFKR